jgi:outer membrane protein assembly factor BamD
MRKYAVIAMALAMLCSALSSDAAWKSSRKRRYDCSKDLTRALSKYSKGRFNEVKTILGETKYQCTGHDAMDSILYYLGMSSLFSKAPEDARAEFDRLVVDFPNSPFAEEARFRTGHSSFLSSYPWYRDQSKTLDAIRELNSFIDEYPQSRFADSARIYLSKCHEKLADKEFETAKFYQKLEKYEAAIVYYRSHEKDFPDSKNIYEGRISSAYCLAKLQRVAEARVILDNLLKEQLSEDVARKAKSTLDRLDIIAGEKPGLRFLRKRFGKDEDSAPAASGVEQPDSTAN